MGDWNCIRSIIAKKKLGVQGNKIYICFCQWEKRINLSYDKMYTYSKIIKRTDLSEKTKQNGDQKL